ncbi:MAG: alpha/beta hydrolase [Planctomycetes bacterium]|nr:alpha/beta hydrolase [Planctomycetota bacterium]
MNGPTRADIPYLGPDRAEMMDAYLPPERFARPCPAVLLIHGGGWCMNDKANERERNIGATLSANGYAVFSINYLLNSRENDAAGRPVSVAWPQNFIDCVSALRHIRAHAAEYGIDPQRIGVMGGSAGGHLAMLVGASATVPGMPRGSLHPEQPVDVRCIITFYGIHDVHGRRANVFAGASEAETAENVRLASPSTWFGPATPPILIAHGTADTIVPVENARALTDVLRHRGVPYWYVEISGAPHTFHLEPEQMDLRPLVLSFLARHLGAPAQT